MEFSPGLSQKLGMLATKIIFWGIPIDSSTVFDIVTYQILLKKLLYYGISNKNSNRFQVIFQTEFCENKSLIILAKRSPLDVC